MSEKKGKKMRRLSRAASKRIRGGNPGGPGGGTFGGPPYGNKDHSFDPLDGPAVRKGKPTEEWLVAVLNGNASQTAKDAVSANH